MLLHCRVVGRWSEERSKDVVAGWVWSCECLFFVQFSSVRFVGIFTHPSRVVVRPEPAKGWLSKGARPTPGGSWLSVSYGPWKGGANRTARRSATRASPVAFYYLVGRALSTQRDIMPGGRGKFAQPLSLTRRRVGHKVLNQLRCECTG